jgi:putative transposase
VVWERRYHLLIMPEYRRKVPSGRLKRMAVDSFKTRIFAARRVWTQVVTSLGTHVGPPSALGLERIETANGPGLKRQIGPILRELCRQRGTELLGGHAMPGHVHPCLSVPPKDSAVCGIWSPRCRSAMRTNRELLHGRRMTGLHPQAMAYYVSAVILVQDPLRRRMRRQGRRGRRQGELDLEQG